MGVGHLLQRPGHAPQLKFAAGAGRADIWVFPADNCGASAGQVGFQRTSSKGTLLCASTLVATDPITRLPSVPCP